MEMSDFSCQHQKYARPETYVVTDLMMKLLLFIAHKKIIEFLIFKK